MVCAGKAAPKPGWRGRLDRTRGLVDRTRGKVSIKASWTRGKAAPKPATQREIIPIYGHTPMYSTHIWSYDRVRVGFGSGPAALLDRTTGLVSMKVSIRACSAAGQDYRTGFDEGFYKGLQRCWTGLQDWFL